MQNEHEWQKEKLVLLYQLGDRIDFITHWVDSTNVTKYSVLPLQNRERNLYLVRVDSLINKEAFTAIQEKQRKIILLFNLQIAT